MTTPDSEEDIEARLRGEFPGWSIIRTDRGNWWATRAPLVREDLEPDDVATLDAPNPAELYLKLKAVQ